MQGTPREFEFAHSSHLCASAFNSSSESGRNKVLMLLKVFNLLEE